MTSKILNFVPKKNIQTQTNKSTNEIVIQTYLAPAYRDFLLDKGLTPYFCVVKPEDGKWSVPEDHVKLDKVLNLEIITFNLHPTAAVNQLMSKDGVFEFSARFGGVAKKVWFLSRDIHWVYAIEAPNNLRLNFVEIKDLV